MKVLVSSDLPFLARQKLLEYFEVIDFQTNGITYPSIAHHPDIFFCQTPCGLVIAPNTPFFYRDWLQKNNIDFQLGSKEVGKTYPDTAFYNAVFIKDTLVHNTRITEEIIKKQARDYIFVRQGYVRCNLVVLRDRFFLTSDRGIEQKLKQEGYEGLWIEPSGIILKGQKYGFLGGTCGIYQDRIFFAGSLKYCKEEKNIRYYLKKFDYEWIELFDHPLIDVGGFFFWD